MSRLSILYQQNIRKRIVYRNYQLLLVITKDEVICSANKQLEKLVNVYVMLFIENKNRKQKRDKGKKAYHSYHYSLGYQLKYRSVPPVQLFADLTLRALVGIHIRTFIVLHGYFSLGKTSGPTIGSFENLNACSNRFHQSKKLFLKSHKIKNLNYFNSQLNSNVSWNNNHTKSVTMMEPCLIFTKEHIFSEFHTLNSKHLACNNSCLNHYLQIFTCSELTTETLE